MPYELADQPAATNKTSRRAARIYVGILLSGIVCLTALIAIVALRLGPPVGDLGRVGGLGSRDYGSRGSASVFVSDHFTDTSISALMSGADLGDILIFGDSFSQKRPSDGHISWLNTLYVETGLDLRTVINGRFVPVQRYLTSDAIKQTPPKAIIIQSVERNLLQRAIETYDPDICPPPPRSAPAPIPRQHLPTPVQKHDITFDPAFRGIEDLLSWGSLALRQRVQGHPKVLLEPLSRDDLFTSKRSDTALIFVDDVTKSTPEFIARLVGDTAKEQIRCSLAGLLSIQSKVPVWLMIAPDKRTIFAPWFTSYQMPKPFDASALGRQALGPALLDIEPLLRDAVASGPPDIYWPDDSHWGPAGHLLVGHYVAGRMTAASP